MKKYIWLSLSAFKNIDSGRINFKTFKIVFVLVRKNERINQKTVIDTQLIWGKVQKYNILHCNGRSRGRITAFVYPP